MLIWLGFIACTAVIVYSGSRLSKYGDILAEKTGLGRTWMGVVMMASVTSLPELVTGISSVTYADAPDIAAGNVLGACVFNLLTFAFLDALHRPKPISSTVHRGQTLAAGFGMLLLSVVAMSLFLSGYFPPIGWIGPYSLFFIFTYLIAMRLVFFYEKRQRAEFVKERAEELRYKEISTRGAALGYALYALLVVGAASFLPAIGKAMASATGLGQTFVGSILIAFSTTLPEVTVSVSAVRMGAVDMAMGNLFGSNLFNILLLAIDDFFFVKGPLLNYVSPGHAVSALSAIAMTSVAVIGLTYRAEKKRLYLAWDSIGIMVLYVINVLVLYMVR